MRRVPHRPGVPWQVPHQIGSTAPRITVDGHEGINPADVPEHLSVAHQVKVGLTVKQQPVPWDHRPIIHATRKHHTLFTSIAFGALVSKVTHPVAVPARDVCVGAPVATCSDERHTFISAAIEHRGCGLLASLHDIVGQGQSLWVVVVPVQSRMSQLSEVGLESLVCPTNEPDCKCLLHGLVVVCISGGIGTSITVGNLVHQSLVDNAHTDLPHHSYLVLESLVVPLERLILPLAHLVEFLFHVQQPVG